MPRIEFPFSDFPGIARDIEPFRLPPGAWSDGNNVLFKDKRIVKAFGHANFIASPTIAGRAIFFCPLNEAGFWIYAGLTDVRAFDSDGTTAEITNTGGDYTGGEQDRWNFAYLHGLGIVNNGVDDPQLWSPPSLSTTLVDLTNWPASTTCRVMRSYLNYLVALDVTKSGTRYASMVKWSHPAAAGAVPSSWDETDATKQAGENLLSETPGVCVDCFPLGASNIIYKEDSAYVMQFIGGQFVFGFSRIPAAIGLIAQGCVAAFKRNHFVVTNDDVVIHDGITPQSLVNERVRSWLFNNIERAGQHQSFVLNYLRRREIWFCFPQTGSTVPNIAMIWSIDSNAITFRDLAQVRAAVYTPSLRLSSGDTWNGEAVLQWGSETALTWDDASFINVREHLFIINEADGTIDRFDETIYTANGGNERSYIERRSMAFAGTDSKGQPVVDLRAVKFIHEIWPRITGTAGTTVSVYVGTQMEYEEAITWLDPVTFTIGTTNLIPVYKSCRFLSIRFEATDSALWELHGFDYTIETGGQF